MWRGFVFIAGGRIGLVGVPTDDDDDDDDDDDGIYKRMYTVSINLLTQATTCLLHSIRFDSTPPGLVKFIQTHPNNQAHLPNSAISPIQCPMLAQPPYPHHNIPHSNNKAPLPSSRKTGRKGKDKHNSPAPKHIMPKAPHTTLPSALLITSLNINSCAINSTNPV